LKSGAAKMRSTVSGSATSSKGARIAKKAPIKRVVYRMESALVDRATLHYRSFRNRERSDETLLLAPRPDAPHRLQPRTPPPRRGVRVGLSAGAARRSGRCLSWHSRRRPLSVARKRRERRD